MGTLQIIMTWVIMPGILLYIIYEVYRIITGGEIDYTPKDKKQKVIEKAREKPPARKPVRIEDAGKKMQQASDDFKKQMDEMNRMF